jgi:hypothetical protein
MAHMSLFQQEKVLMVMLPKVLVTAKYMGVKKLQDFGVTCSRLCFG